MKRVLSRSNISIPFIVLVVGIVSTVVGTAYVRMTIENRNRVRFERATASVEDSIESHIRAYMALMDGARGFFSSDVPVTRDRFHRFAEALKLGENYPGIQGLGYSAVVRPEERAGLVETMRAQGHEDFHIWPEGERPETHAILFLEPEDERNKVAIGFDMFSEATRREAMVKARDSGGAAMSGKVTLVQEIDEEKQPGFLIYLPVYEGGSTPFSLAERRSKFKGFVYCPFRAADVLRSVAERERGSEIALRVYDGGETKPEFLLHDLRPEDKTRKAEFENVSYAAVARRTWALASRSLPQFESSRDFLLVWLAAIVGTLVTALLFTLSWSQMRSHRAAALYAAQLRESREKLASETSEARKARADAERANRLKDEFLATVSHELRTPLNAIMGWADLLMDEPAIDSETRHGLDVIRRNVRAQSQLVDDLLDVSRITSGRLRLGIRPIDPREAIESAIESVRPSADAREVAIRENYCADVPILSADPARLQQIVWNLLSNAIKFSPAKSEVVLDLDRKGENLVIRVTDFGQGIDKEFLPYVFNAFRQADASFTRKHTGLGLGLAIVRHLVEMHGGTIDATSDGAGKGACFTVELPARKGSAAVEDAPSASASGQSTDAGQFETDSAIEGLRILVVDDEADARELLRTVLERSRAEVLVASSADDAIRIFSQERPDAIVSDIGMPERDGYSLIREIRRMEKEKTPAIALTAFAASQDRAHALEAGFDEHLPKPIRTADLLATLARLAGRRFH